MSENLDPPEHKGAPSGEMEFYIERPVPTPDEWQEFEVVAQMDEGRVHVAWLHESQDEVTLTRDEIENAEVKWSEDCAAYPDERDDGDRDRDR